MRSLGAALPLVGQPSSCLPGLPCAVAGHRPALRRGFKAPILAPASTGPGLGWAMPPLATAAGSTDGDLLELYCGNGNFTQALAPNFRKARPRTPLCARPCRSAQHV